MKLYALLFALLIGASSAYAQVEQEKADSWSYLSKTQFEFKGFSNNEGDGLGWLVGIRFDRFFNESPIYWDLGVDFGKASSIDQSSFSFVGLGVGAEKVIEHFLFGARANIDLMSEDIGSSTNTYAGYDVEGYAGIVIAHGWRLDVTSGYLHTFLQPYYSGLTFGLKLEYKAERTVSVRPVND